MGFEDMGLRLSRQWHDLVVHCTVLWVLGKGIEVIKIGSKGFDDMVWSYQVFIYILEKLGIGV